MGSKAVTTSPKPNTSKRWIIAKAGNVEIPAYELADGRICVSYYEAGTRKRRTFADKAEAKREAGLIAAKIRAGQHGVLELTSADRESYLLALSHLSSLGIPLHAATEEYANARGKLPTGVSLSQAVEFYLSRNADALTPRIVSEVVAEFIVTKEQDGASKRYRDFIRVYLRRFEEAFRMRIGDITSTGIETWIRSLGVASRTRKNIRALTVTLLNFAKSRGYLPRDRQTEAELVPRVTVRGGDVHIFTPEQLARILEHADADSIPFIVLSAFAGLRHAEVLRLEWHDIKWEHDAVEVGKDKAKTATRRMCPLLPNTAAWLAPYREKKGLVCRFAREQRRVQRLAESLGIEWHQNVLRHSFISYRVAQIEDVAKVALEAGNSPQIIFSNYRQLVTKRDAEAYFQIAPKPAQDSVLLQPAA